MDNFTHDILTRKALAEDFKTNYKNYEEITKATGLDLDKVLNEISPKDQNVHAHDPDDAIEYLLNSYKYSISSDDRTGTTEIGKFMDDGPMELVLETLLKRDYDQTLGIDQLRSVSPLDFVERDANTDAGSPGNNSPQSPNTTLSPTVRNQYRPKITIQMIAGQIETINGTKFEKPEYVTTYQDESTRDIPELANIPLTTISTANERGQTKKYGGGYRTSIEFSWNELNVSFLRVFVMKQAMNDEIKMVNEGLACAIANAGSAADLSLGSGVIDESDILDLAMFDGDPNTPYNGYQLDLIIGVKEDVKDVMQGYLGAGNPGFLSQMPGFLFPGFFNGVILLNGGLGGPRGLGFVRNDAVTGITANTMLGLDTRLGLTFVRVPRGTVDEVERVAKNQSLNRYITRRSGWFAMDPDACFNLDKS